MKILIKIYSDDKTILDDFNDKISNKSKTKISLVSDTNLSIPISLNSDLNSYKWDVVIPIYKSFIPVQSFDNIIRNFYKQKYPNFDGVLWLNDGEQKEINTLPIIGKKYYKEFGYIYNPSYSKMNFEKEFTNVLKLKEKCCYVEDILFEKKNIISDDEHIYNFRKKLNFCLIDNKVNIPVIDNISDVINTNVPVKEPLSNSNVPISSSLNKFVDNVYVINLERRKDRLIHITKELTKLNISFERFNAIDGFDIGNGDVGSAQVACLRSHVGVLKDAIDKGYKRIVIFEDDIIFCDDFEKRLDYYAVNVPKDWDIMYLGGSHFSSGDENIPFINKIKGVFGCFAMILNNKNNLFETIIELTKNEYLPIDDYYCKYLTNFNLYIFVPFFVKTLKTKSDISIEKEEFSYGQVNKYFKNYFDEQYQISNEILDKNFSRNSLNYLVDEIYCLSKNPQNKQHIIEQFNKIDLVSFKIMDNEKDILQDAIDKNYDKISIFSDDIVFCDDFKERFDYYMKNVPNDWDIMYFGIDLPYILNPITMIKSYIYRVWMSKGFFALIINNKNGLFQKIIDSITNKQIDVIIESMFPLIKAYTFLPFLVSVIETNLSHENINRHFKDIVSLPKIKITKETKIEPKIIRTQKDLCEEHIKMVGNFMIYFNNNLIFDSSTSDKMNLAFFDEHFEVFGRQFPYRGMFIKRK